MSNKTEIDRHFELVEWIRTGRARELREQAGLTRPVVAEELKVTRHSVMNWELGRCLPQRAAAMRYHELLERLAGLERLAESVTSNR